MHVSLPGEQKPESHTWNVAGSNPARRILFQAFLRRDAAFFFSRVKLVKASLKEGLFRTLK